MASDTPLTARVIASRIVAASVVKRAASCAGASRSIRARSLSIRWPNIRFWRSRMTTSTRFWVATDWPNCTAALMLVTTSTWIGIW